MILTVSTVKDTLPNIERFVAGNLANGVDHMFVFLDAPDPEVRGFLDSHEHVTAVRTDTSWWHGRRPEQLNNRQRRNANVVNALLSGFDWAEWLFHIDGDEIALIDRAELDGVPAEQRVVRLEPLEAVSQLTWEGDPTHFKRLLGNGDLTLLQMLGVLRRPSNDDYFHGHVAGKVGLRPCLDLWLALHHVVDADRTPIDAISGDGLRLLHYESWSGEDFVRKWTSILAAGPMASFRPSREPTAVALRTLIKKGLSEEQTRPYLMRIYERTTLDDFETLRDLGLLEEHHPLDGTHVPVPFPEGAREAMNRLLAQLHEEPKSPFRPGTSTAEVEGLLARVGVAAPDLRARRRFLRRS